MSEPLATDAMRELLTELPQRFPVERIDRAWLFAPREVNGRESGLVVLSLLPEPDRPGEERVLVTLRYEAERDRQGRVRRTDEALEQGRAPEDVLPRLISGVLRRLGDPAEAEPLEGEVRGDEDRWTELLSRAGLSAVDPPPGE